MQLARGTSSGQFVGAVPLTVRPAAPARASQELDSCPGDGDGAWVSPPPVHLGDGTRLQLYKDGEALHAAYRAIESARRLICLEVYIFASDDTGRAFAELLRAKARSGVRVFVIYDSFGSLHSDREMFRKLEASGVRLQQFHPMRPWESNFSWRPFNRDHRKLLVIDNHLAGIGGLNIGAEYSGSWIRQKSRKYCDAWRDSAVGIVGPGASLLMKAFSHSWSYVTHGGRMRRAEFAANLEGGELGMLASVPTVNSPLRPLLCRLMRSARESIDLTMAYFAPDDTMIEELCRAARRGIHVRLMLPGHCDVPLVRLAARSFYETLLGCGIQIYERQGVVLHAKTMVLDEATTVIGSTNLDYRSIEYNCESSAIIRSQAFASQMRGLFENDVKSASKIELGEWRRRPYWDRFVLWAVSRARYLL